MFNFSRDGDKVKLSVTYKSGELKTNLLFYWQTEHPVTAEALAVQLENFKDISIEREIKTAYEAGYKAGRQRKTKRTWFHCYITHINDSLQDWKKE